MRPPTHKQRVLALLSDGQPHTHHELYALHVVAHSRISDLRNDGHLIAQWREGDDYIYQLVGCVDTPVGTDGATPAGVSTEPTNPHGATAPPQPRSLAGGAGSPTDRDGQLVLTGGAFTRSHTA